MWKYLCDGLVEKSVILSYISKGKTLSCNKNVVSCLYVFCLLWIDPVISYFAVFCVFSMWIFHVSVRFTCLRHIPLGDFIMERQWLWSSIYLKSVSGSYSNQGLFSTNFLIAINTSLMSLKSESGISLSVNVSASSSQII